MRVLIQGRIELQKGKGGGDMIQIENTMNELKELRVEVDFKTYPGFDPEGYDIVHIFQLDWTPETYIYADLANKRGIPIVISPIHHSVKEVKRFDDEYVFDFRRLSGFLFEDQFSRDTLKNIYRSFFNPQKLYSTMLSARMGFKNMQTKILTMAAAVLVQTNLEAQDLKETFNVDFSWYKIPNGVSSAFLDTSNFKNRFDFEDYVICVGRLEPRKNQIKIIEAVNLLRQKTQKDIKLVLVGSKSPRNHFEYTYRLNQQLKKYDWVKHIDYIPNSEMPGLYKFAKVGVSASWFETTGLTSLEAVFCGTNAVASGDRAKEYLGDYASFCDPGSVESILSAVESQYFKPRPKIDESIKNEYTWKNAAKMTLTAYNQVLNRK